MDKADILQDEWITDEQGQTQPAALLESRLSARTAVIGVIGLGYVGLPLAMAVANAGFSAIGFDIDAEKIVALDRG